MGPWLLDSARTFRRVFYRISSAEFYGIEIDNFLHFGIGALLFTWIYRRRGSHAAWWVLAACVLVKELIDVFAKSRIEYINSPSASDLRDIVLDVAISLLGGAAAWWWLKRRPASAKRGS